MIQETEIVGRLNGKKNHQPTKQKPQETVNDKPVKHCLTRVVLSHIVALRCRSIYLYIYPLLEREGVIKRDR